MSQQGAVVTGAGRGLGKQIARLLAERGHRVLVTDVDAVTAQAAAEEIGHGATAMVVDVRDRSQVDAAREHIVETAGSLSVWVNNAGVRSEEHTSELQSLMRIPYAVVCLKKKK